MPPHRLFGISLASDFLFAANLGQDPGPAELFFAVFPPLPPSTPRDPVFSLPQGRAVEESLVALYRSGELESLRFPGITEFHLRPNRISGELLTPIPDPILELLFLGPVLSYWLERRGIPTLHASAVATGEKAAGFLSSQGSGKTGLAAAMMQAGHPLLTDDILPLEERGGTFFGRSGYPQMKMWPDEAAHFLGSYEHLRLVHPQITKRRVTVGEGHWGAFHEPALPLAALYVPERREGGPIEITPLSRGEAVIELVRHSFSPHLVQAVGLQPARLDFFARLVRQVPVRRLAYPSGFERLPEVVAALRRDLP